MLTIIAAVAKNGVIGRDGKLPWTLKDDMLWFKETTGNHPVVMGRRTFDSIVERIHKPLPNRENIILTSRPNQHHCGGATFTDDWKGVLARAEQEEIFVIGGAEVYKRALPHATKMHITHVDAEVEGDIVFPEWDRDEWRDTSHAPMAANDRNEYPFTIFSYFRERNQFIEMTNCRTDKQRTEMGLILHRNHCPFCPEALRTYHDNPTLWESDHWFISNNDYPYNWTKEHLILILKAHVTRPEDIPPEAFKELADIIAWTKREYDPPGLGFFLRGGDCRWTGGTIRHIHAHIATRRTLDEKGLFYLG